MPPPGHRGALHDPVSHDARHGRAQVPGARRDAERPGAVGLVAGDPLPLDPDRWAAERQYLRNDTGEALAALRTRREDTLAFLKRLTPEQWKRGSIHVTLGRMTFEDWVALIAAHDDTHLDQLKRALEGRS